MNKKLKKIMDKVEKHEGLLTTNDLVAYGMYKNNPQASYLRSKDKFPTFISKIGVTYCYTKETILEYLVNNGDYILEVVLLPHAADKRRKSTCTDVTNSIAATGEIMAFKDKFNLEIDDLCNRIADLVAKEI